MQHEDYGELQRLVDVLFKRSETVSTVDVLVQAEADDLGEEIMEVVHAIPSGTYRRARLCDQINSIVTAHGWGFTLGTVDLVHICCALIGKRACSWGCIRLLR